MPLTSRAIVKWKEPEAFRVTQDKVSFVKAKPWLRPVCACGFIFYVMVLWYLNQRFSGNDHRTFLDAFTTAIFCSIGLFYGLPWMSRLLPSWVVLYPKGIGRGTSSIPFKMFRFFTWSDEGSYWVLHLINEKGGARQYGVPDPTTREKIEPVLVQRGLSKISAPVKPDFEARRKAIWGQRVFAAAEVEAMRDEETKG
jgi:hypothetical protein